MDTFLIKLPSNLEKMLLKNEEIKMGIEFRVESYVQHIAFIVKSNGLIQMCGILMSNIFYKMENMFHLFSIKLPW